MQFEKVSRLVMLNKNIKGFQYLKKPFPCLTLQSNSQSDFFGPKYLGFNHSLSLSSMLSPTARAFSLSLLTVNQNHWFMFLCDSFSKLTLRFTGSKCCCCVQGAKKTLG